MGQPKENLPFDDGTTLLHRAFATLENICAGRVWVARPYGYAATRAADLVDQAPQLGPLSGIVQALSRSSRSLLAVLAVDLPEVSEDVFQALYRRWLDDPSLDLVYAAEPGGPGQPLAGLWHLRTLPIAQAQLAGSRQVAAVVDRVRSASISVPVGTLINVNTPNDWTEYQRRLAP